MKKELLKTGRLLAALMVSAALVFTACDKDDTTPDGPDGPDGPSEQAPATPNVSAIRSGEEVTITWDSAVGIEYYTVDVINIGTVDEKGKPVPFEKEEDVKSILDKPIQTEWQKATATLEKGKAYEIYVTAYTANDTPSEPGSASCVYFVLPLQFEKSCELSKAIADKIAELKIGEDEEMEVTLMEGVDYTLEAALDLGLHQTTFKVVGNAEGGLYEDFDAAKGHTRPIVTFEGAARLFTASGLVISDINFDCTNVAYENAKNTVDYGFITMSPNKHEARIISGVDGTTTYKYHYLNEKHPIVVKNCDIKNMQSSFFASGQWQWAIDRITIENCLIQADNSQNKLWGNNFEFIAFSTAGNKGTTIKEDGTTTEGWINFGGGVREFVVKKSTIYNIAEAGSSNTRFYVWTNANAGKKYVPLFFDGKADSLIEMEETIIHGWSPSIDNFANNGAITKITFNKCIFYNCYALNKLNKQGAANLDATNVASNYIWNPYLVGTGGAGAADSDAVFANITEFSFTGTTPSVLDFTQKNGGQNFKYSVEAGDPRWNE